jgi:hypothetical protein
MHSYKGNCRLLEKCGMPMQICLLSKYIYGEELSQMLKSFSIFLIHIVHFPNVRIMKLHILFCH